jgi:hypothetical protein
MCRIAPKAARALKQRVRQITRRNGGRSLQTVVAKLSKCLPVWKEYFQLADTPKGFADCDKWIRHRLRALQLKQWKRGPKVYAEMRRLGLSKQVAAKGRGGPPTLVVSCRQVGSGRTHHQLLRPHRSTQTCRLTSTFRTAGCGSACRSCGRRVAVRRYPLCRLGDLLSQSTGQRSSPAMRPSAIPSFPPFSKRA